jgi:pyruvate kinase
MIEPAAGEGAALPPLTKFIATIGPASSDETVVSRLIEAGVSIFRLNFGHGTIAEHEARLRSIRTVAERLGRPIGVLGDLQGPKIRIGRVAGEGLSLDAGASLIVQREPIVAEPGRVCRCSCTYRGLVDDVKPGERLLINDGAVRMLIVDHRRDEIECTVTQGGLITSGKGVNLPDSTLRIEPVSDEDWALVSWAVTNDLDYVAMSFVSCEADVRRLRDGIEQARATRGTPALRLPIIAKIERPSAVERAEEIIDAADAIMVARGDLGVEMDLARVPVIQKQLALAAHDYGKPCIIATQMLQSMIDSPIPTRAEASDVAGAIFDGVDAVMLSGETAIGRYPVLAVETMSRIARHTEAHLAQQQRESRAPRKLVESRYRTAALAHGVWTVARDIGAAFIVVWSQQGGGARYLSQNEFSIPIIAVSTDDRALRQMQLLRGVTPVRVPLPESMEHFTRQIDVYLTATGWAKAGDCGIIVAGTPLGRQGVTRSLSIHVVGHGE